MRETRNKGYFQGGQLLYGYQLDGRKIIVNECEAEIVRYMYSEYAKGVYVKDILKDLAAKGITYKGRPFVRNSVYNILRNEKYSGVYKHGEEVIANMYPQIVPTELYEKVRAIVNKNKFGKRSVKADFLLRHKIKCGYCGQSINAESGTTKNGTRVYYYKCNGRKKRLNDCQKSMVRKEVLEELVLNTVMEELNAPETIDNIVSGLLQLQDSRIKTNPALSLLLKEQRQTETALNNLVAAIERGILSNTTNKRLHELESRQEELERLILIEKSKTAVKVSEQDIREFYEQALREEPKKLINCQIKEIVLFDDRMEIYFNSPIKKSPDESRGFSFYNSFADMHVYLYSNTAPQVKKMRIEMYVG